MTGVQTCALRCNAVSPYWIKVNSSDSKKDGNAGNGSPRNILNENATYEVTIEKRSGGYYASYKEEGGSTLYEKTFKSSEAYLTTDKAAQFGIAINSADITVSDIMLTDSEGNTLYDQNNVNTFKPTVVGSDMLKVTGVGSVMKEIGRAHV